MKTFDTGMQEKLCTHSLVRTGPNPYTSTEYFLCPARRHSVSASSVVQGNFTDPNSWSYVVKEILYAYGEVTQYTYYTYPESLLTTKETTKRIGPVAYDTDQSKLFPVTAVPADVINKALGKLNDMTRGNIDLSIDLLQAGQTKKMLSAANAAELFTRNFKGLTQLIAGVSAIRLQYVYGVKPTLQTIFDCADRSINLVLNKIEHFEATASTSVASSDENVPLLLYGNAKCRMMRDGRLFCKIGVKLRTEGNNPGYWTSLNPASIAWEMMPYSFVVDWFVDVGSYLRNLETSLLFANRFVNGFQTEGVMYNVSGKHGLSKTTNPAYGTYNNLTANATCSGRYRQLTRTKLLTYPAPRLPTFSADLGSQRLLNAAALLGVLLREK